MATASTERRHIPDRRAHGSDYSVTSANRTATGSRLSALDWVVMALLIIGGINWGLIGLFSFDLVAAIFGAMSPLSRVIYTLVGLAALYSIYTSMKMAGKTS